MHEKSWIVLKHIGFIFLKFLGVFLLLAFLYSAEMKRGGITIYLVTEIVMFTQIIVINLLCQIFIKDFKKAYIVSAIIIPVMFCLLGLAFCLSDWQYVKDIAIMFFSIIVACEIILFLVTWDVRAILKLFRNV